MRVHHFVKAEFGIEDIRLRRLKIATINDLNDPFEFLGASSPNREIRRRFEIVKQKLSEKVGMLCFSRNWSNPVQWSHYADKHRGLCLGFEVPSSCLRRVAYSGRRLKPNIKALEGDWSVAEPEMLKILTTKFSHWRYEREVRCFAGLDEPDTGSGLFFMPFSNDIQLREVIVGHASNLTREDVRAALRNHAPRVRCSKARLAFRSYSVVKQRNSKLWR